MVHRLAGEQPMDRAVKPNHCNLVDTLLRPGIPKRIKLGVKGTLGEPFLDVYYKAVEATLADYGTSRMASLSQPARKAMVVVGGLCRAAYFDLNKNQEDIRSRNLTEGKEPLACGDGTVTLDSETYPRVVRCFTKDWTREDMESVKVDHHIALSELVKGKKELSGCACNAGRDDRMCLVVR